MGNNLGIIQYHQSYDQKDLDDFFSYYSTNIPNGTHPTLNLIAGATGPTDPGPGNAEAMLDLEVAYPLVYPTGITFFQTNGLGSSILDALDIAFCDHKYECGIYQPTNVISISWASRAVTGSAIQTRICNEWGKLGLQGVSVLAASGDGGVGENDGSCRSDGSFSVGFPSSCPYVTSVGATMVNLHNSSPTSSTLT